MKFLLRQKRLFFAFLMAAAVPAAALLLYSCGGSSNYSTSPTAPQVMISPQTLNNWVENGYPTDANGYTKLVILDVDSASGYGAGHIPGSYNLDTGADLRATRSNGVVYTVSQVPTRNIMDALIQRTGIDEHTVVAFVGDGHMLNVGRAYFNFRYWGFPRERLKVLNGTKTATYQNDAGFPLSTTSTPLPSASSYSVADLTPDVSVRASMEEMISLAQDDDPFTVVIDARSEGEYNGDVRRTRGSESGTYVAFEGHVKTAEHLEYSDLHQGGNRANPLLPENELIATLTAINMDEDSTGISYCRTSWRAAAHFLALDGMLGWNAKIYDGAWIQWGQMASNDPAIGGSLENDSPWRTDIDALSENISFNRRVVGPIDSDVDSFADNANLINEEDKAVCGGSGTLPNNRSVDVMITPAALNGWVTGGFTDTYSHGYTDFVVLHVDTNPANYDAGHIPGSYLVTLDDIRATRNNGIADTVSQVATNNQMDDILQRAGIDENTVVVFATTPGNFNMMTLGRAYFNFRYWGFPREQLRVMDGFTTHYSDAGYTLSTVTPADAGGVYSVCDLRQDMPLPGNALASPDEVRATFEEMFGVGSENPDDPMTVVADARSDDEYNGVIGRTSTTGGFVAFEGHVRTAAHSNYVTLLGTDGWLLPDADLQTTLNGIGADASTTVYSYCRTSWRAAVHFLALDAALGWPVKIYDGAWIQWGQMATNDSTIDGSLDPDSPWRTDTDDLTESLSYNKGPIIPEGTEDYAPHANVINTEDAGTGSAGGGSGGGPGGGSPQPEAPGYN